ncbi:MAG: TetR/AcrR family transcriptional regulator [Steroidobacteraceae bacterium]
MADSTPAQPTAADPAAAWRGRRRRQDHGTKRDAVIRTAARAFDERGYHNTSLDDIAAALGVTKPTVYYYVPNKEQLLFECFLAGLDPIRAALRRAEQTAGSGRDRLREVIHDYAVAIASDYGWCMVRAEHQDLGPELSAQVRSLKSEIDRGIRRLLQTGISDGSIAVADPKLAAFAIAGSLNWIAHWYRAGRKLTSDEVADAFVQLLEHGLAPRAPGEGKPVPAPARVRRPRPVNKG